MTPWLLRMCFPFVRATEKARNTRPIDFRSTIIHQRQGHFGPDFNGSCDGEILTAMIGLKISEFSVAREQGFSIGSASDWDILLYGGWQVRPEDSVVSDLIR